MPPLQHFYHGGLGVLFCAWVALKTLKIVPFPGVILMYSFPIQKKLFQNAGMITLLPKCFLLEFSHLAYHGIGDTSESESHGPLLPLCWVQSPCNHARPNHLLVSTHAMGFLTSMSLLSLTTSRAHFFFGSLHFYQPSSICPEILKKYLRAPTVPTFPSYLRTSLGVLLCLPWVQISGFLGFFCLTVSSVRKSIASLVSSTMLGT